MPLYEYACPTCHARFDRLQTIQNGEESPCPDCGTLAKRVLSMFASFTRNASGEVTPVAGGGCGSSCGSGGCGGGGCGC